MKHLKRFFENRVWRYDEDKFLKFLYDLDGIKERIDQEYVGSDYGYDFGYVFDETDDTIVIDFGYSGYSDDFHRTMKVFYNHFMGPTKVISSEGGSGFGDSWESSEVQEFDSYDAIIADLKDHFGF